MVKVETIEQFGGFGNLVAQSAKEHFRSAGFTKSANGMVAGRTTLEFFTGDASKYPQYTTIDSVNHFSDGKGRSITDVTGSSTFLFFMTALGEIYQSLNGVVTPELVYPVEKGQAHFTGTNGGFIVDQKNRLLYAGSRYLGMWDTSVVDVAGTADFTSASTTVTATSGIFIAGDAGKIMRIAVGSAIYYARIQTYTSGTVVVLNSAVSFATGQYTIQVLRSWTDRWKDFGATLGVTSEGYNPSIPTETYEDTVLFGRGNVLTSLNTLTDTVTTDAVPAFTLPSGFDILNIHKGANGILIASNFQRKGVLVLWDNFSDRSIAPWINLQDRIISVCKYNGGWLVITTREFFYTNGYSITSLIDSFLDSKTTVFESSILPQTSLVIENDLYCQLGVAYNGKRRHGLYKIDLDSKLAEYVPRYDNEQLSKRNLVLFYGAGNGTGKVYIGTNDSMDFLNYDAEPDVATLITNPVGIGENYKYAEALKVNLGVSPSYYQSDQTFSFSITAKIYAMDRQMIRYASLKVAMTDLNKITINESTQINAEVGDEVEFWGGVNAGYSRNIISKTGAGTSTAVLTLDRDLPHLDSNTSNLIFFTPFKLIKTKTYTNIDEMPEVWFDIKNKVKGKKFMLKIDIEDATVPIELKPMLFMYDELGIL